ncbi:hypothetical protein HK405_006445, partial [Cladochytrium tenue]
LARPVHPQVAASLADGNSGHDDAHVAGYVRPPKEQEGAGADQEAPTDQEAASSAAQEAAATAAATVIKKQPVAVPVPVKVPVKYGGGGKYYQGGTNVKNIEIDNEDWGGDSGWF